jgi:hypothetical protein
MAVQDFDIGKQANLDIVVGGQIVDTAQLTSFEAKQEVITITSRPLGGPKVTKKVPDGWTGSFDYDRLGPLLDNLFADREEAYWSAGDDGTNVTLSETFREKDGSISQYRYEQVSLELDAGKKTQDERVIQKVMFTASRRRKV